MMADAISHDDRRHIWALCYRMTGVAADADDLVQDTMVRALERPPARTDEPLRPWLVRVAMNLARDMLRARKRRAYKGPWLPSPVDDDALEIPVEARGAEGRYDLLESASMAFLLALEALTPKQRAVLLLADVFDYSVREVATALDLSEANVKTTHHRARHALERYDRKRAPRTSELVTRTREALERFLTCIALCDSAAAEALLSDDVRSLNDGGGEFFNARVPLAGKARIVRFYLGVRKLHTDDARFALRSVGGLPALVAEQTPKKAGFAPRFVIACELGADGKIASLYTVLSTHKLTGVARLHVPPPTAEP